LNLLNNKIKITCLPSKVCSITKALILLHCFLLKHTSLQLHKQNINKYKHPNQELIFNNSKECLHLKEVLIMEEVKSLKGRLVTAIIMVNRLIEIVIVICYFSMEKINQII